MYRLIKRFYGEEIFGLQNKTYATKEDAENAGNSWVRDCRVDQNIKKGRNFEVILN